MTEKSYYEVEIKRDPPGWLVWGEVYCVTGDKRRKIGDTRERGLSLGATRDYVIRAATKIARRHRDGADIVRLDLDAPERNPDDPAPIGDVQKRDTA